MTATPGRLILASASSARAKLLRDARVAVAIDPADIDETAIKQGGADDDPAALAAALALAKARHVTARHRQALVLGADQILVCDGRLFDKPKDRPAARQQLLALRGRTHRLISAACVVRDGTCLWQGLETVQLTMHDFSDRFLDDYLEKSGPEILESVGVYRLEGRGIQLFSHIEGTYFAVLGLPMLALLDFLRGQGILKS